MHSQMIGIRAGKQHARTNRWPIYLVTQYPDESLHRCASQPENNGKRWEERLREGENPATGILLISYTETRSYVYNVLRVAHLYEAVWRAGF